MGKAGSGFKKPVQKKAFTKKDIISVSALVAVVAVLIIVFAIVVSSDDFIRTKNGRLQMEDNWLIAEYAKNNGTKYYQIGEVADIEGFTLGTESAANTLKTFYPDDPTNNVAVIYVGGTVSNHAEMAAYLSAYTAATYGNEAAMPQLTELCGREAYYVHSLTAPIEEAVEETTEEAAEEAAEEVVEETAEEVVEETAEETADETVENIYSNDPACMLYATIEYDDERCIFIQTNTVEEITEEEGKALIETIANAITIIER